MSFIKIISIKKAYLKDKPFLYAAVPTDNNNYLVVDDFSAFA